MEGRSLKLHDRQTVASKGGAMNKIRLQELILFLRTFCFMNLIQTRLKVMMIFFVFFFFKCSSNKRIAFILTNAHMNALRYLSTF